MNEPNESTYDFLVRWRNKSHELVSPIKCDGPAHRSRELSLDEPQIPLSILQTSKILVAVANIRWTTPTTINLTHNRAGLSLLHAKSQKMSITYGYDSQTELPAREGHIALFLPGKPIHSQCSEGTFRSVMCSFDPEYAESVFSKTIGSVDQLSESQWMSALDVRNSLISSLLMRLMQEVLQPSPISDAIVDAYGHSLLLEAMHWLTSRSTVPEPDGKLSSHHFTIIDEYLAVLSGRIPRVSEIAEACGFSERYFSKLFRENTKITVGQYMKSSQIAKAKKLLLETDLTLQEISYRLGFSSQSNFSSAFKSVTGVSPGIFRQQP